MRQYLVSIPPCLLPACEFIRHILTEGIRWLENSGNSQVTSLLVSQGPQAWVNFNFSGKFLRMFQYNKRGLTYEVAAGDRVFVYGKRSPKNGATAIFTLDDMAPESVNTTNAHQVGSDPTVLWSSHVLANTSHTLRVDYDPQSREGDVPRYLFLYYFSYNEPSE